jgi:YidC/Oxa1 family membrane protein insertase
MKTDKNTVIGFVLLGLLFFIYFWYSNKQPTKHAHLNKNRKDSTERVRLANIKPQDTVAARIDSLKRDSATRVSSAGDFTTAALGSEQLVTLENGVMKVTFTSKGAQVKSVELKKYKSAVDGKPVVWHAQ